MRKGANISKDGKYRYMLWRIWKKKKPYLLWVMLNPSKADADIDDHTITKCIGYARANGYGGIYVGNLFAYRATNPDDLLAEKKKKNTGYIIGNRNEDALLSMKAICQDTIIAWGNHGLCDDGVVTRAIQLFPNALCLGLTGRNQPKHPLRLSYDTKLKSYQKLIQKRANYSIE